MGRDMSIVSQGETTELTRQSVTIQADPVPSPLAGLGHTSASMGLHPSALSTALLAQQLPPIGKFSGETASAEGETFEAWHEHFEMVASVSHWDTQTKLVNLTTRLRGQAYAFYRSCTPQQRANYDVLVAELTKRFMPVRLQSVQSSMFHERKQKSDESVDAYAQDLRRLFHLAYPKAQQGTQEAESMGRSVLAYQFVAGLLPDIKLKLAGVEGSMDELLAKARLQEAKLRDMATPTSKGLVPKKSHVSFSQQKGVTFPRERGQTSSSTPTIQPRFKPSFKCFHCQGTGHLARNCPMRGRAAPAESGGRNQGSARKDSPLTKVASITVNREYSPVEENQQK